MKPFVCPSCGQSLADRPDPHKLIEHLPLGPVKRTILRVLAANFSRTVETSYIASVVYTGADGGPDTAESTIKSHAFALRKLLKPYGLTVIGVQNHGYRYDWIEAPALRGAA